MQGEVLIADWASFSMEPLVVTAATLFGVITTPYLCYAALYLLLRPRESAAEKRAAEPTVSVVLPTYNEAGIVERKLEDVCALDYPLNKVEVVIVDASDDDTIERICAFFADRDTPELTLIEEEERRGLAVALNEAYAAATGEVVVKTDCDSLLAPDAVREAVANLEDPDIGAVTGQNAAVLGGSAVETGYRGIQARVQSLESHLDSTLIFHGPCSAFDADAIVPIDVDSIADDTELALKIRKRGKRVLFDPAIKYQEAAHSAFRKRRQQKDRRAMGLLRLLWRQREMLGRYGYYGRIVLPFNWWFMMISPWLVLTWLFLASAAAVFTAGLLGLAFPAAAIAGILAGARDRLGPLQPFYSLFDTQVSLWLASLRLLRGEGDGTWDIDAELREVFE
jgi:cellulose synthase/poly-beta-1,6-N-acetylglucosamine synthase-like glycosyltransferase